MNNFEKFNEGKHETYREREKEAPSFRDIYPRLPHYAARTQVNAKMEKMARAELGWPRVVRQRVPDAKVNWRVSMPEYDPPMLDIPRGATRFRKPGDAPQDSDPRRISRFKSREVRSVMRNEEGYPLNPMGRTGLAGRGILDKWGPTDAADPVLTRHNPSSGQLEVLLIQRGDTGEWAFPGGKVDPGENPPRAAGRELIEEAGVRGVRLDFSKADVVYSGYIDDSRNTDNAWMESTALHLHLSQQEARRISVMSGSDADAVRWANVDDALFNSMLKAHADILSLTIGERPRA